MYYLNFIDTMTDLFNLLGDGFKNLINFVKSIPDLFYSFYVFLPSPINNIVFAFIPLLLLVIFYKFVRGY